MTKERIIIHVIPKEIEVCIDRKTDGSCTVTMEGTREQLDGIISVEQDKDGKYAKCTDDKERQ